MTPSLISSNRQAQTVIISIAKIHYTYFFLTAQEVETVEYLFQKVSPLKGLNYAKGHCERAEREADNAA